MQKRQNILTVAIVFCVVGVLMLVAGPAFMERRAVSRAFDAMASGTTSFEVRRVSDTTISSPTTAKTLFEVLTIDGKGPNASCYALPNAEVFASGAWRIDERGQTRGLDIRNRNVDAVCRLGHAVLPSQETRP